MGTGKRRAVARDWREGATGGVQRSLRAAEALRDPAVWTHVVNTCPNSRDVRRPEGASVSCGPGVTTACPRRLVHRHRWASLVGDVTGEANPGVGGGETGGTWEISAPSLDFAVNLKPL